MKKGDVVEVCLAFCRLQSPAIAAEREEFVARVAEFYDSLTKTIAFICRCDDKLTKSTLPNPTNFARLIIFTWSGIHSHSEDVRTASLAKADSEMDFLIVRIGAHNWKNKTYKIVLNAAVPE